LTNGPGKICIALKIDKSLNGLDFTDSQSCLRIEDGIESHRTKATKRIGLTFGTELKRRYSIVGNINYTHSKNRCI
jgi:DNA-3-methyladenine glycosylase